VIQRRHHRPPDFVCRPAAAARTSCSCCILASWTSRSRTRRLSRRMSESMRGSGPPTCPSSAFATAGPYSAAARDPVRSRGGCAARSAGTHSGQVPMNVLGMGVLRPAGCSRHQCTRWSCVPGEAVMVTGWRRLARAPAAGNRGLMTGSFPGVKRRARCVHEPPFISSWFEGEP